MADDTPSAYVADDRREIENLKLQIRTLTASNTRNELWQPLIDDIERWRIESNAEVEKLSQRLLDVRAENEALRVRAAAAPQPQPEVLTADDLNFIASVLTDVASERAESEDQPDGAHDAAVLWRIARTAAKLAFRPQVDHGAVPASPWQPIATDWAQCSHTFVEVNGDTPDGFTAVRCSQCQCPGERNNTTGDVFWPAT